MSTGNKVVWSEGMFLRPQHFQQQDRYFETLLQGRIQGLCNYQWGFQELELDSQLLKLGKIAINRCKAILPDGTPVQIPDVDTGLQARDIPPGTLGQTLYLGLPVRRAGVVDVQVGEASQGITRFKSLDKHVIDNVTGEGDEGAIQVGELQLRLLLENEDRSGFVTLGVARIRECTEDNTIILDENHIPPLLNIQINPVCSGFLKEFSGLIHQRAETLAARMKDSGRGGSAEINDYLLLQLLNRLQPAAEFLLSAPLLHPYALYYELIQMAGELATFTNPGRRPPAFATYLHDQLEKVYSPLLQELRRSLSTVLEQSAISLELVERKYGIRVSPISDRKLLQNASFILAVKANIRSDKVRSSFPTQVKIGPVEQIRELINAQLPGISLQAMPVAPRQIPYHSGFTYFQLDRSSEYWQAMSRSGGFAVHVAGEFPGLEMEFWAIRD
ncbi:MAG: type VI secretion system baseplate subunit TssK [Gammaproteobacteria bacterium]|nr:MAG: type VI secretion system baseplate subunit TssK [Pseudomonadota bacterium]PIE38175.1 MAG: type VI secretion system baseplate subunit TssK [Gammaproteobacteria bacterium]